MASTPLEAQPARVLDVPGFSDLMLAALDAVPPPNDWCVEQATRIRATAPAFRDSEATAVWNEMVNTASHRLTAITSWLSSMETTP